MFNLLHFFKEELSLERQNESEREKEEASVIWSDIYTRTDCDNVNDDPHTAP